MRIELRRDVKDSKRGRWEENYKRKKRQGTWKDTHESVKEMKDK